MQSLWQDLRYGMRGIRANPGFSLLAILTLALGIGAGTTMFSVIKNVLLSPFPYKDATRIAAFDIHDLDNARPGGRTALKAAEYLEYRQQNHVFDGDTGGGNLDVLWTTGVGTEQLDGAYVTPDTFQFLGVAAQVGRGLVPEDGKSGAPPVFVMSYKMWASLAANRVLSSELWGVSARDPLTFGAVAFVVLMAGIAACWFPARRATRVDPMIALRFE